MTNYQHEEGSPDCPCYACCEKRAAILLTGPKYAMQQYLHVIGFQSPTSTGQVVDLRQPIYADDSPFEFCYTLAHPDGEVNEYGEHELRAATVDDMDALSAWYVERDNEAAQEERNAFHNAQEGERFD